MEETKLLQKHESSAKNVEEGRMTYMASSNMIFLLIINKKY